MPQTPYQLHPGRAVGALYLGTYLQDVLGHLKSISKENGNIALTYSPEDPTTTSTLIDVASDGLRLRFDGPEQRLRLIEVLDFNKAVLKYKGHDIFKPTNAEGPVDAPGTVRGPTFRSLTKLLGPTFPGEYLPPHSDEGVSNGTYILSYPGVAFSFPVDASKWDPSNVSELSSSSAMVATTMAVFEGRTWAETRQHLFSPTIMKAQTRSSSNLDSADVADEVSTVKVYGEGRLELIKRSGSSFWIILSQTTPQDLISELGAPDAIYNKSDRRLAIHKIRQRSSHTAKGNSSALADESEDEDPAMSLEHREIVSAEHFYNYLKLGIDILIGQPASPSMPSPTVPESRTFDSVGPICLPKSHLTATKLLIHGNVPGAWDFNRHRRCRWTLEHVPTAAKPGALTSEDKFSVISERLKEVFSSSYATKEEAQKQQRAMPHDRGWGASPDDSCELLGGWEENVRAEKPGGSSFQSNIDTKTELFGYPGMIFEVLKNGTVNCLTVY